MPKGLAYNIPVYTENELARLTIANAFDLIMTKAKNSPLINQTISLLELMVKAQKVKIYVLDGDHIYPGHPSIAWSYGDGCHEIFLSAQHTIPLDVQIMHEAPHVVFPLGHECNPFSELFITYKELILAALHSDYLHYRTQRDGLTALSKAIMYNVFYAPRHKGYLTPDLIRYEEHFTYAIQAIFIDEALVQTLAPNMYRLIEDYIDKNSLKLTQKFAQMIANLPQRSDDVASIINKIFVRAMNQHKISNAASDPTISMEINTLNAAAQKSIQARTTHPLSSTSITRKTKYAAEKKLGIAKPPIIIRASLTNATNPLPVSEADLRAAMTRCGRLPTNVGSLPMHIENEHALQVIEAAMDFMIERNQTTSPIISQLFRLFTQAIRAGKIEVYVLDHPIHPDCPALTMQNASESHAIFLSTQEAPSLIASRLVEEIAHAVLPTDAMTALSKQLKETVFSDFKHYRKLREKTTVPFPQTIFHEPQQYSLIERDEERVTHTISAIFNDEASVAKIAPETYQLITREMTALFPNIQQALASTAAHAAQERNNLDIAVDSTIHRQQSKIRHAVSVETGQADLGIEGIHHRLKPAPLPNAIPASETIPPAHPLAEKTANLVFVPHEKKKRIAKPLSSLSTKKINAVAQQQLTKPTQPAALNIPANNTQAHALPPQSPAPSLTSAIRVSVYDEMGHLVEEMECPLLNNETSAIKTLQPSKTPAPHTKYPRLKLNLAYAGRALPSIIGLAAAGYSWWGEKEVEKQEHPNDPTFTRWALAALKTALNAVPGVSVCRAMGWYAAEVLPHIDTKLMAENRDYFAYIVHFYAEHPLLWEHNHHIRIGEEALLKSHDAGTKEARDFISTLKWQKYTLKPFEWNQQYVLTPLNDGMRGLLNIASTGAPFFCAMDELFHAKSVSLFGQSSNSIIQLIPPANPLPIPFGGLKVRFNFYPQVKTPPQPNGEQPTTTEMPAASATPAENSAAARNTDYNGNDLRLQHPEILPLHASSLHDFPSLEENTHPEILPLHASSLHDFPSFENKLRDRIGEASTIVHSKTTSAPAGEPPNDRGSSSDRTGNAIADSIIDTRELTPAEAQAYMTLCSHPRKKSIFSAIWDELKLFEYKPTEEEKKRIKDNVNNIKTSLAEKDTICGQLSHLTENMHDPHFDIATYTKTLIERLEQAIAQENTNIENAGTIFETQYNLANWFGRTLQNLKEISHTLELENTKKEFISSHEEKDAQALIQLAQSLTSSPMHTDSDAAKITGLQHLAIMHAWHLLEINRLAEAQAFINEISQYAYYAPGHFTPIKIEGAALSKECALKREHETPKIQKDINHINTHLAEINRGISAGNDPTNIIAETLSLVKSTIEECEKKESGEIFKYHNDARIAHFQWPLYIQPLKELQTHLQNEYQRFKDGGNQPVSLSIQKMWQIHQNADQPLSYWINYLKEHPATSPQDSLMTFFVLDKINKKITEKPYAGDPDTTAQLQALRELLPHADEHLTYLRLHDAEKLAALGFPLQAANRLSNVAAIFPLTKQIQDKVNDYQFEYQELALHNILMPLLNIIRRHTQKQSVISTITTFTDLAQDVMPHALAFILQSAIHTVKQGEREVIMRSLTRAAQQLAPLNLFDKRFNLFNETTRDPDFYWQGIRLYSNLILKGITSLSHNKTGTLRAMVPYGQLALEVLSLYTTIKQLKENKTKGKHAATPRLIASLGCTAARFFVGATTII